MNIAENILAQGKSDALALLTAETELTYAELRHRVARIAQALSMHGHEKGERIGIFAENSAFFVAAYLGIIRAGLVAVPLQTELSSEALAMIAVECGMRGVFVSQRM